jgi:hypothetical protein
MDQLKIGFLSWLSAKSETYPELIQLFDGQIQLESEAEPSTDESESVVEGYVYMMKSGEHYKIGKSKDLDRRQREIRTQMPESVDYTHFIKTDDMAGIERYWHRRFEKQRVNGEWFKLSRLDISVFKKRKFQ